jgi:Zn-dependent protease with chaperone function
VVLHLLPAWAAALVALVPGLTAFWWGRDAATAGDPARAERLAATRKRTGAVFACSIAALVATALDHCLWAVPLLVVVRAVAGYYIRRRVLGESWSMPAYLSFFARLIAGATGPLVLLAFAPNIVGAWPGHSWLAAALLAVCLWTWNHFQSDAFRIVLRARPIQSGALAVRFRDLAERCALPPVWFGEVDLRGGVVANAVALPSIQCPAVVFTSTLLQQLTEDEAVGICAHEVAHLEHFAPRLRRMAARTALLAAVGCFLGPVVQLAVPALLPGVSFVWVPLLVAGMAVRARNRQQNETASDLRALALTGNPEALISALTKLHTIMHVARRWDPEVERQATHPSLARRIQAIRAAAGAPHPILIAATELFDPSSSITVGLHADRLHWSEGEAVSHRVAYSHLTELRIVTGTSGAAKLRAATKGGLRWEMTLAPGDIARAQAALDVVDSRLGSGAPAARLPRSLARYAALLGLIAAALLTQGAVALTSLLALARPSTPLLAAAGTASLAAAALLSFGPLPDATLLAWLLFCGAALTAAAYVSRRDDQRDLPVPAIAALCAATAIAWLLLIGEGTGTWHLHQAAQTWPSAAILPAALAAGLGCAQRRRVRVAAFPLGCTALVVAFVASPQFVDTCVRDPFITAIEPSDLRITSIAHHPASSVALPFLASDMRISPDGRYIAALSTDFDDEVTTVHLGPLGGTLTTYEAEAAVFAAPDRAIVLERRPGGAAVRVIALGEPLRDEQPPITLPGVQGSRIAVTPSGDGWVVLGSVDDRLPVTVSARFGERTPVTAEWAGSRGYANVVAGDAQRVLVQKIHYRQNLLARRGLWQWAYLLRPAGVESQFFTIDKLASPVEVASSALPVTCEAGRDLGSTVCAAFDGRRTRLFAFDPAASAFRAIGGVQGHLVPRHVSDDGWVSGWLDSTLVAVQPRTNEAVRVESRARVYAMTATDHFLAAATMTDRGSILEIYTRPDVSARR